MQSENCVSNIDLTAISSSLDEALKESGVSSEGLCPKRHELYKDCFDSVILELTNVNDDHSMEGAFLLSRIRDELNTTSDAYKKLYESSVSFGLSKAIEARKANEKLHIRIDEMLKEKREILDENEFLKRKLGMVQRSEERKRERDRTMYELDLRKLVGRNEKIKRGIEQELLSATAELHDITSSSVSARGKPLYINDHNGNLQ